jgi:hypothetical protein
MSIKLEKWRQRLSAIADALLTLSESVSLVRDAAYEKKPFEKSLDNLQTVVAELKSRAARSVDAEALQTTTAAVWLRDVAEFVVDIMVDAEAIRDVDACLVNILDSECIEVLKLIRDFRRDVEVTD